MSLNLFYALIIFLLGKVLFLPGKNYPILRVCKCTFWLVFFTKKNFGSCWLYDGRLGSYRIKQRVINWCTLIDMCSFFLASHLIASTFLICQKMIKLHFQYNSLKYNLSVQFEYFSCLIIIISHFIQVLETFTKFIALWGKKPCFSGLDPKLLLFLSFSGESLGISFHYTYTHTHTHTSYYL